MSLRYPADDSELKTVVRDETSYDNVSDELPASQLDTIVERAKGRLELKTGSDNWYSNDGLGFALVAYTAMRAKAAVENVPLDDYSLGDTNVSFTETDPETSQQLQQWAEDISLGLAASGVSITEDPVQPHNTSEYIGESYYETS